MRASMHVMLTLSMVLLSWLGWQPVAQPAQPRVIRHLATNSQGQLASGAEDGSIVLHGVRDDETMMQPAQPGQRVEALVFSPSGRYLAAALHDTAGQGDAVRLWQGAQPEAVRTIRQLEPDGMLREVVALSFNLEETVLYLVDRWHATLYQLRVDDGVLLGSSPLASTEHIAFNPAGGTLFVSEDSTVWMYNLASGSLMQSFELGIRHSRSLALSAAQGWLAVGADNGEVRIYTLAGKPVMRFRRGRGAVQHLAFSEDDAPVHLVSSVGRDLYVWEFVHRSLKAAYSAEARVSALAWVSSAHALASAVPEASETAEESPTRAVLVADVAGALQGWQLSE